MSEDFMKANPKAAEAFLRALHQALWYYGKHPEQADTWYTQELNISLKPAILRRSASYDENLGATIPDQIDLSLSEADIAVLQASSDFAFGAGLIKTHPVAKEVVDAELLARAKQSLLKEKPDTTRIHHLGQ